MLSFTIDKYIYITAKPCTNLFPHKYRLVYSQVEEVNDRFNVKHPIIRSVLKQYNVEHGLDLDVMSDIPAGTGMGSSSAFTVGLHQAISKNTLYSKELAERACDTEIRDLKEPIGKQDQYAAAYGGCNLFDFSKEEVVRYSVSTNNLRQWLHLVYVGKTRNASKLLMEQSKKDNTLALNRLACLARLSAGSLSQGDLATVGSIVQEGWELKKSLSPNVSNERIDDIIDTALRGGAIGGKR